MDPRTQPHDPTDPAHDPAARAIHRLLDSLQDGQPLTVPPARPDGTWPSPLAITCDPLLLIGLTATTGPAGADPLTIPVPSPDGRIGPVALQAALQSAIRRLAARTGRAVPDPVLAIPDLQETPLAA